MPRPTPITTFETDASKDSQLTVNLPALMATYEKPSIEILPSTSPRMAKQSSIMMWICSLRRRYAKSIKRLSPTSAELTFQLNTGADKYVSIRSFHMNGKDIKKISAEFSGDTAVMTLEFDKDVDAFDLNISWPMFRYERQLDD